MCAFTKLEQAWFSSHHALRCLIGGLRAKYHTPLSLRHDEEGGSTHISSQIHCLDSVALCCSIGRILERKVAGQTLALACRPLVLAGRPVEVAYRPIEVASRPPEGEIVQSDPILGENPSRSLCNVLRSQWVQTKASHDKALRFRAKHTELACLPLSRPFYCFLS